MRVILLQNIKNLGRIGDIKNVSDGYGRNYLLARGLAKLATKSVAKEVEFLKKKAEAEEGIALEKAKEAAEKANDIVLEFTKKASKTGKLFASLTKKEIAESLSKVVGRKIEPGMINLNPSASSGHGVHGEHIKQIGEHLIEIELAPEIKTEIKIVIH